MAVAFESNQRSFSIVDGALRAWKRRALGLQLVEVVV